MTILLFTTCMLDDERLLDLHRCCRSVADNAAEWGVPVQHLILLQRAAEFAAFDGLASEFYQPTYFCTPERVSLSRARNILLARAIASGALARSRWIAFPDDDAWYPAGLLRFVDEAMNRHAAQALVCQYASQPVQDRSGLAAPVFSQSISDYYQNVSSNTIFLRSDLAGKLGYFDERLGVGAQWNGGEDLDYGLRLFEFAGKSVVVIKAPLVGHRDKQTNLRAKYFIGSAFALARSSRKVPGLRWLLLRKLLIGGVLLIRGQMKPGNLFASLRLVLKTIVAGSAVFRSPDQTPVSP